MEYYLVFSVVVLVLQCTHGEYLNITNLTKITEGIELAAYENALRHVQSSYKLEDFFWTGSGDGPTGPEDESDYSTAYTTKTVYVTTTTYTTTTPSSACQSCDGSTIEPTTVVDYDLDADKEFWLLTVLKSDGKDPDIVDLRKSLANLYKKAFLRQQAKHLGIKPRIKREDKPINVYIHKIDRKPINGEDKIEVVYHVAVSGQPVDAVSASEDMRLVTDNEVKEELGFPFLVKAEPYIKPTVAQELAEVKSTWLFISISLIILIILILGVILIAFCITKRKTDHDDNKVFGERDGHRNAGFQTDTVDSKSYTSGRRNQNPSPTYINFRTQASTETLTNVGHVRPNSGLSSSTLSSNGSVDISPLMSVGKPRKMQRPKAAVNKTVPLNVAPSNLSTSSSSSTISDAIYVGNDPGVISPKSYLSMPSVKAFPRSNNPEPLNKVLEPLSMHHLDMHDTDDFTIARHGSLGASEDPGVIGPVVWNLHKHRMQQGSTTALDDGDIDDGQTTNVSKMRKRFHELLDDTFSLFGSRRESPMHKPIQVKSQSAMDRNFEIRHEPPRPKTSEPRRTVEGPRGAWMSTAPSPLVRPISAPFDRPYTAPRINRELILVNGVLKENDPAIPLIEEIKKEIDKCSTPNFDKPGSSGRQN